MGYKSDVRINTTMKGFKILNDFVENRVSDDYNLLKSDDFSVYEKEDDVICFGWQGLKWYESYNNVDAIMDGLTELNKQSIPWTFDRIGENVGDIDSDDSTVPCYTYNVYHSSIVTRFADYGEECKITYKELLKEVEEYEKN